MHLELEMSEYESYHESIPKKVAVLSNEVIADVVCGDDTICVVTSTGSLHTFGSHGEHRIVDLKRKSRDGGLCYMDNGENDMVYYVTKDGEVLEISLYDINDSLTETITPPH